MPYEIDETHDPKLESWVESANDPETDFPIQNLPLFERRVDAVGGTFSSPCIRIGNFALDIMSYNSILCDDTREDENEHPIPPEDEEEFVSGFNVHDMLANGDPRQIRKKASWLLRRGNKLLQEHEFRDEILIPMEKIIADRPRIIGDYTDFYASVHHATNVGTMFRPDNPLLPNYKWIPVGYHGRASSVVASGTPIVRPSGQLSPAEEGGTPSFGPCKLLDYELELGMVVGRGNELGKPISVAEAEEHMLGVCLLNDWSARDMQKWEYVPLGPFLAKNFATSVSPYIVTMEALAPFRCPAYRRPEGDPSPLPHLFDERDQKLGGIDITLEVHLSSQQMREQGMKPIRLSKGSFKDMYWTLSQMLTHHASGGCNMQPGDLLGSGTVSGPLRENRGSLLELTWDGDPFSNPPKPLPGTQRTPIKLPTGEERKFLADGDEVILKGYCEREGFRRIGFGECRGIIEPAAVS